MMPQELVTKFSEFQNAKRAFEEALNQAQASCAHSRIIECDGPHFTLIDSKHPGKRFCLDCLKEETSSCVWTHRYSILTTDFIKHLSEENFYKELREAKDQLKDGWHDSTRTD